MFYVFGGETPTRLTFSELYAIDISPSAINKNWTKIELSGSNPAPRYKMFFSSFKRRKS
jgi:hypothetical protein